MNDHAQLATDAHALAVKLGAKLIASEKLCQEGAAWSGKELSALAGEGNHLMGLLDGIYFTAKSLLPQDEFERFVYRSGIDTNLVSEGVERAQETIDYVV